MLAWLLLMLAAATHAGTCVIEGADVSLAGITVRPSKGAPFTVAVSNVSATARISAARGPVPLSVKGAVSFSGTAAGVEYTVAKPVVTGGGIVRLFPGQGLSGARARGQEVVGRVSLGAAGYEELEGDDEAEVTIDGVRVPCAALTLDAFAGDDPPSRRGDGTHWGPRGRPRRVIVRAAPSTTAPAIVLVGRRGWVSLAGERLAEREGWMRLSISGERWALDGWIERRRLVKLDDDALGSASTCECPDHRFEAALGAPAVKPRYQGPARIAVGTPISDPDGVGTWARVEKEEGFEVMIFDGARTADVLGIPGVSGPYVIGIVPLTAVTPTRRR